MTEETYHARALQASVSQSPGRATSYTHTTIYDAYFKNKAEQFKASNESIQILAKEHAGYKYFGAKGLVLMAKNFYKLNDAFQATYILESVIKNFEDYSDIIEEATAELAIVKSEQAKTNDSIEIEEKN